VLDEPEVNVFGLKVPVMLMDATQREVVTHYSQATSTRLTRRSIPLPGRNHDSPWVDELIARE
jgi:hypothetical protein